MTDNVRPLRPKRQRDAAKQAERLARAAAPIPAAAEIEYPVTCLGHRQGEYYYLSPSGELRMLTHRDHSRNGIVSLLGGDTDWCLEVAASTRGGDGGWNHGRVAELLMKGCTKAGLWREDTPVRSIGVWASSDGKPIVHCGGEIQIDGEWVRAGIKHDDAVYAAVAPIDPPDFDAPATEEDGSALLGHLRRWNFRHQAAPHLVLGYLGVALLGGAPSWRTHLLFIGPRGSGKSTLLARLLKAALGDQAEFSNNFTEAGLRVALSAKARAVLLDEVEPPEDGPGRVEMARDLIRQMSDGEGAKVLRGGTTKSYAVTGSVALSGILAVELTPQDRSRITEIELLDLVQPATGEEAATLEAELERAIEWAGVLSPKLRARAIDGFARFQETYAAYRAALIGAKCDRRMAQQFGSLMAGRDLLLFDTTLSAADAASAIQAILPLTAEAREADATSGEGQACLNRLITHAAESWSGGERKTIARIVMEEMRSTPPSQGRLGAYGLRLDPDGADVPALLVAHDHNALSAIFHGTRWAGGKWARALKMLPGAERHPKPMRFDGAQSRCVRVPVSYLPRESDP